MLYCYDGSFPGLLTIICHALRFDNEPTDIHSTTHRQTSLFTDNIELPSNETEARFLLQRVEWRCGKKSLDTILHAFLSDEPGREIAIWHYLQHGRTIGRDIENDIAHPAVNRVEKLALRSRRESHRMLGLIRFEELEDGLYYSRIETDTNVLPLVADHFQDRFADQQWMIHDLRRQSALISSGAGYRLVKVEGASAPKRTEQEGEFKELWRSFFTTIAIPERKNRRCQQQFMPKKYWKFLPECLPTL